MSTLSLFVNTLFVTPIHKPFDTRYVFVAPREIKLKSIQKVFAIIRDDETPITIEVDASNSSNLMGSVVLDTTLTHEFMICGVLQEEPTSSNFKAALEKEIHILDSSSDDEESKHSIPSRDSKNMAKKPENIDDGNYSSALELILKYPNQYRLLAKAVNESTTIKKVAEIPADYNGNLIYELPPAKAADSSMDGMEQRYDGHCWLKPVTSRITFPASIRKSKCAGHLRCANDHCAYLIVHGDRNEKSWKGNKSNSFIYLLSFLIFNLMFMMNCALYLVQEN